MSPLTIIQPASSTSPIQAPKWNEKPAAARTAARVIDSPNGPDSSPSKKASMRSFSSWMDNFSEDKQPADPKPAKKSQPAASAVRQDVSNDQRGAEIKPPAGDHQSEKLNDASDQPSPDQDPSITPPVIAAPVATLALQTLAPTPLTLQIAFGEAVPQDEKTSAMTDLSGKNLAAIGGSAFDQASSRIVSKATSGLAAALSTSSPSGASLTEVTYQEKSGPAMRPQTKSAKSIEADLVPTLLGAGINPGSAALLASAGIQADSNGQNRGDKLAAESGTKPEHAVTMTTVSTMADAVVQPMVTLLTGPAVGNAMDSSRLQSKGTQSGEVAFTATIKEISAPAKAQTGDGHQSNNDSQGGERNTNEANPIMPGPQTANQGEKPVFNAAVAKIAAPRVAPEVSSIAIAAEPTSTSRTATSISLNVDSQNPGVNIQLVERGGKIEVSVRTPDTGLTGDIRARLNELVDNLSSKGFETQTWTPEAGVSEVKRSEQGRATASAEPTLQPQQAVSSTFQSQNEMGGFHHGESGNNQTQDDTTGGRQSKGEERGQRQSHQNQGGEDGDRRQKNLFRSILEGARP